MIPSNLLPNVNIHAAKEGHFAVIHDYEQMMATNGWKRLMQYLEAEMNEAYAAMFAASTGDMALKANAVFTTIKNIKDLPTHQISMASNAVRNIEEFAAKKSSK